MLCSARNNLHIVLVEQDYATVRLKRYRFVDMVPVCIEIALIERNCVTRAGAGIDDHQAVTIFAPVDLLILVHVALWRADSGGVFGIAQIGSILLIPRDKDRGKAVLCHQVGRQRPLYLRLAERR